MFVLRMRLEFLMLEILPQCYVQQNRHHHLMAEREINKTILIEIRCLESVETSDITFNSTQRKFLSPRNVLFCVMSLSLLRC